jgi:class 3 adenylate cyclase/tetratricopeptide (TPR) repeat protein
MDCCSCSARLPAGARFCPGCGAAAAVGPGAAEERKVVTVLFCDVAGSTALAGRLDPEPLRMVLLRYAAVMRDVVEARGGVVEKFIGDAVMAVFGLTATREDDAHAALAAARDMLRALSALNDELGRQHGVRIQIRVGVHTGEVVTTADPGLRQALVSGEVVNIAARLQAAASANEILISSDTRRAADAATEAVGPLSLKGVARPVDGFRLLELPAGLRTVRRFDVPFVGRERYLGVLDLIWCQVTEAGDSYLLTVLGEAGIGKTRLAGEWLARRAAAGGQAVLAGTGRCRTRGDGGSLGALAECLATLVDHVASPDASGPDARGTADAAAVLRAGLLTDGTPAPSPGETFSAVARVLTALALEQPVVLVLDDCHWADPMLLDLLGRLADEIDRLPVLFVCLARPDLLDTSPRWGSGRANATTIMMSGLSAAESELLAASYADVTAHDGAVVRQIVAQAGGNPFYLEQLAAAVGQGGPVRRLPPGLQALLAARIDQLGEAERLALRHAAVLGRAFDAGDLGRLAGAPEPADEAILRALARHRLIEATRSRSGERIAYRFVSALTQRVAYDGLTKLRRSELHERYACHLAGSGAPKADIGGHLARAYTNLAAVAGAGEGREHAAALRRSAADCLTDAGAAALRRIDLPWAVSLLSQALDLADDGHPLRPRCLQQLGEALLTLGQTHEGTARLRQAASEAARHRRPAVCAHARLQLAIADREPAALVRTARETREVFSAHDDQLGLARSCLVMAAERHQSGRYAEALELLGPALAHAASAGADRELANTLGATGLALLLGPEPAAAAAERCEVLVRTYGTGRLAVQATLGFPLTMLHAIQGQNAKARERRDATRQAMAAFSYAEAEVFRPLLDALVMLADGEARPGAEALDHLHAAGHAARAMRSDRLTLLVSLETARVHLRLGDWARAREVADSAPAGTDAPAELASQLGIRARLAARGGQAEEAARLAAEAVRCADRTDSPTAHGLAHLDRALTAAALGRNQDARLAAQAARQQFAAKGHRAGLAEARRLLDEHLP